MKTLNYMIHQSTYCHTRYCVKAYFISIATLPFSFSLDVIYMK